MVLSVSSMRFIMLLSSASITCKHSVALCVVPFNVFLPGIVSTEPGVMISIVFIWDCIYRAWSYVF
jgi:hypothetical protein